MKTAEEHFENELEVFRTEADTATQFFYSLLTINTIASKQKKVLHILNNTPLFWNTVLGGLQTSSFIALGRIFDQKSTHNIDKVLKAAQDNMAIFSKNALAERKRKGVTNADEWLTEYLTNVYVPSAKDFRRLRSHVNKKRIIFENNYRTLRHKFFAHKDISQEAEVLGLFNKTNIPEIQKLLKFLRQLHEALWQLYNNGRKPILLPTRYSVEQIIKNPSQAPKTRALPERLIYEIETFLYTASNTFPSKNTQNSDTHFI